MAVVEGGNRLYRTELASIKHAYIKSKYSILDHVQSMRPKLAVKACTW